MLNWIVEEEADVNGQGEQTQDQRTASELVLDAMLHQVGLPE
jgi:hypothetical protein